VVTDRILHLCDLANADSSVQLHGTLQIQYTTKICQITCSTIVLYNKKCFVNRKDEQTPLNDGHMCM